MRPSILLSAALSTLSSAQNASTDPGYNGYPTYIPSTIPSNTTLSFGTNFAILNLDLINGIIGTLPSTPAGAKWVSNVAHWIDAVHALPYTPLTIFTRIYYANSKKYELGPADHQVPFTGAGGTLGTMEDNNTAIYPAFQPNATKGDLTIVKTRYYAGAGNELEEVLRAMRIDTVILSGVRTSGVILNTAYRLFDLDYKVYVIANNTIENPSDVPGINAAILEGVIPKLPANVITIEQALEGIKNSGPNGTASAY